MLTYKTCKQIVNDIRILKKLDHENILKIYNCYQDQQKVYVVEERFNGVELMDYIIQNKKIHYSDMAFIMF